MGQNLINIEPVRTVCKNGLPLEYSEDQIIKEIQKDIDEAEKFGLLYND